MINRVFAVADALRQWRWMAFVFDLITRGTERQRLSDLSGGHQLNWNDRFYVIQVFVSELWHCADNCYNCFEDFPRKQRAPLRTGKVDRGIQSQSCERKFLWIQSTYFSSPKRFSSAFIPFFSSRALKYGLTLSGVRVCQNKLSPLRWCCVKSQFNQIHPVQLTVGNKIRVEWGLNCGQIAW